MEATTQETVVTEVSVNSRLGRKTGQSKIPNWTIQFPRRQQWLLGNSISDGRPKTDLLQVDQGAARVN
jgi:hypothetical protein